MKNKILKRSILFLFFTIVILCTNKVNAATTENYYKAKAERNFAREYTIKSNDEDITEELVSKLKEIDGKTDYSLIYIPSGTYNISDDNNLVLHSNTYLVAEKDTNIIKTGTTKSILRTRKDENAKNIKICGGIWDGNNNEIQGLEINNAQNVIIENVNIKNCNKNGIYLNNQSNATIKLCTIEENKANGVALYTSSTANVKDSKILSNKQYGICVTDSSILYANENASNTISYNDLSGISVTKQNSKIYINGNTITCNGQEQKSSGDNVVGHGVGISESAFGDINNNTITNNHECGISVFDGGNAQISNNNILYNGRHGIGARMQVNMNITNNIIDQNSYNGILIADRTVATLQANIINNSKKFGLSIVDNSVVTSEGNTISNNNGSNVSISGRASTLTLTKNNTINKSKTNNGINLSDYATLKITGNNNSINENKAHGISVTSKNATLKITGNGNFISKNNKSGIYVDKAKTIKITGKTTFKQNKKSGLAIYSAKATIKNVTLDGNKEFGISIRNKGNLEISKSTIKNNKAYGIQVVDKGTKAKIEKNNIYKNKDAGINVDKKSEVSSIYKNELNKNGDKAIRICGSAKVKKIKNNKIKKHSKYGIYIKGAKVTTLTGNKFSSIKKKNQVYKV